MIFTLGLIIGIAGGCGVTIRLFNSELASAWGEADQERTRARNLHRRAQKAEGRLQRMGQIMREDDEG